jgi:hypothetical protein
MGTGIVGRTVAFLGLGYDAPMKLDLVSTSVVSLLVAASVTLIACPRKPDAPPVTAVTPEVIAANTTTSKPPTPPPPEASNASKGAIGDAVNKVLGKKVALQHREKGQECSREKVAGNAEARAPQEGDVPRPMREGKCKSDADCSAGKNGRCSMVGGGRLPPYAACVYDACYVDADCGSKNACSCGGSPSDGHTCEQGNCAVDADCGTNGYCSPSLGSCGNYGGTVGNFCHTSKDDCMNDDECTDKPGGYCAYSQEAQKWQCSYGHCVG